MRYLPLWLLTLGVALAGCSDDAVDARPSEGAEAGAAQGGAPQDEPLSSYEDVVCPADLPQSGELSCGKLTVPERWSKPDSPKLTLFVSRIASANADAPADPVVILAGGPGDTPNVEQFLEHPLRDIRDIIVLDQRGTGRSQPSLACPEIAAWSAAKLGLPSDDAGVLEEGQRATTACRDRLLEEGVDLSAYDTDASAADVDALRRALGIEHWNLVGNSYGTRLALEVMRDFPEGVRSASLASVYPPQADHYGALASNAERAFQALFAACTADATCQKANPDLRATFVELAASLDEEPVMLETEDGAGDPLSVLIDGARLAELLHQALYETDLIPLLPDILAHFREPFVQSMVADLLPARVPSAADFSYGMNLSVECREELPFTDAEAGAGLPDYLRSFQLSGSFDDDLCEIWQAGASDPSANDPVTSDIPTLLLAGELDPITPPGDAARAAESLSRSFAFELPGFGHDLTLFQCPRDVRNAFIDDPSSEPLLRCLEELGATKL